MCYIDILVSFRGRNGYAELGCCKSLFLQRNQSSYKKLKEVKGRGSFGSVYLGKIPDEKSVAVKVRFDKSQLGADSFINEVH